MFSPVRRGSSILSIWLLCDPNRKQLLWIQDHSRTSCLLDLYDLMDIKITLECLLLVLYVVPGWLEWTQDGCSILVLNVNPNRRRGSLPPNSSQSVTWGSSPPLFLGEICAIIVTFVACSFSFPKKGKCVVEVGVAEGELLHLWAQSNQNYSTFHFRYNKTWTWWWYEATWSLSTFSNLDK